MILQKADYSSTAAITDFVVDKNGTRVKLAATDQWRYLEEDELILFSLEADPAEIVNFGKSEEEV